MSRRSFFGLGLGSNMLGATVLLVLPATAEDHLKLLAQAMGEQRASDT
jgi:hypothetical protein